MKKMRLLLTGLLCLIAVGFVSAQNISITGTVKDAANGEPIGFAYVQVKGTTTGTATNEDGTFSVKAPKDGVLIFSFVGYTTKEVAIHGKTHIDVVMESEALDLGETIVVAYGTAKKGSFTGSAATVKNDDIVKRAVSNVTKALEGLAPGVVTTSGGGQPGDAASVQIRGYGSINASSSPLYVVDGIPYDGNISAINPADIESMSVLKDASAGALYGARGANGVIMITTKKGSKDRTRVTYKGSVGVSSRSLKRYDMVSQAEFVELTYEANKNYYMFKAGKTEAEAKSLAAADLSYDLGGEIYNPYKNYTWGTVIDQSTGKIHSDAVSAWDEDWMDAITDNNAVRTEHQLSINGGNDRTQYMLSFGYLYDEGILKGTYFDRFSGRVGVTHKAKYWLNSGININLASTSANAQQLSSGSYTSNAWYTAQFMAPIYPVYMKDANGKDLLDINGKRQYDYGNEGGRSRKKAAGFNTAGNLEDNKYENTRDNVSYRANIDLGGDDEKMGALKGLKFSVNLGGDYINRNLMSYYNKYHGDGAGSNGEISKTNARTFSYTFNQLLTYNKEIGKHKFDVLAGHEFYAYKYNYLVATRTGLVDGIYELAPGTTVTEGNSYSDRYRVESYLARLNYSFEDKYYLSGSWRTDGSSRFHEDSRWGNFWSVGASWRASQEEWLKDVSWLSNLSLRASYGSQGNDDLQTYYAWQFLYDLSYANASANGGRLSTLENKKVTWEKKHTLNIGVDASFFKSRLQMVAEFYHSKTTDLLLNYPMALSTGFKGYSANVGSLRNAGFEFTVKGVIMDKPNFVWDATVMGALNRNKVLKLTQESNQIISGISIIKEGMPIYTFFMAKSAGVDPQTGEQLYYAYEKMEEDGTIVGEYVTNDYSKAATSKYYLGSREPKLSGSVSMNFRILKNFDLSVLGTYSIGGKVYDGLYYSSMNTTYTGDTWNRHVLKRWQKPGDVTDVPRVEIGASKTVTDNYLINASYFALKNITVGYNLPQSLVKKINIDNVRVFATFDNIAMFNHLDGMDPQYNFSGGIGYTYAPVKTIAFGLEINF